MRYERSTWRMETLVTGMVLVSALATPFGATSMRASAGTYSARTVVDGVDLVVRSPALPPVPFVASKPGDVLQGAAAVIQRPYRGFHDLCVPVRLGRSGRGHRDRRASGTCANTAPWPRGA